jgi:hypothetical protein
MIKTSKTLLAGLTLGIGLASAGANAAYVTFTGFDAGLGEGTPLNAVPLSATAELSFKSNLLGTGTEDFEGFSSGQSGPLTLNFPGAGSAVLSGGGGSVASVTPGTTNGVGRYSIPSAGSRNYWDVSAGSNGDFSIQFSQSIAAFGFYGIDIGDFSGTLTLELHNATSMLESFVVSTGNTPGGSVLYFGVIAEDEADEFTSVVFRTTAGTGDIFAFDNMTIGSREQICTGPECNNNVPVPGTLALLGLGGLGLALRRRQA